MQLKKNGACGKTYSSFEMVASLLPLMHVPASPSHGPRPHPMGHRTLGGGLREAITTYCQLPAQSLLELHLGDRVECIFLRYHCRP